MQIHGSQYRELVSLYSSNNAVQSSKIFQSRHKQHYVRAIVDVRKEADERIFYLYILFAPYSNSCTRVY